MSILGLSSERTESEGILKRLFWPSVRNAYDIDLVRSQGFWICFGLGFLSLVMSIFARQGLGIATSLFYMLAAMGVREGSLSTSIMVFVSYLLDQIAGLRFHSGGFGLIPLVVLAILLANIRGSFVSWHSRIVVAPGEEADADIPMRFSETWRDKLVDQMPRIVWPKIRIAFLIVGGCLVLVEFIGVYAAFVVPGFGVQQPG